MTKVLLLVHDDPGQEARVQVAVALTRALPDCVLHCLDVTPNPTIYDPGWSIAPPLVLDETEREVANSARVRERISGEGIEWRWHKLRGDFGDCLLEAAHAVNVIVLNRRFDGSQRPDMVSLVSRVLTQTRALVIAVDPDRRTFDLAAPAIVAWDGSPKVMSALDRALPMLRLSTRVVLFQAGALPRSAVPAEDGVRKLAERGIAAEVEIDAGAKDPVLAIIAAAKRLGAGYCVMGGFSHSRLREALLGGVSRDLLTCAALPLVMAH